MVIGHQEAQRQLTSDGWRYLDQKNQTFAEALLFLGANLVELDEFIEQLEAEGASAGEELRERRRKAINDFGSVKGETDIDNCAFVGHIEWIMLRKRAIKYSDYLLPLARDGKSKREADINRTRALVKANKLKEEKNIERNKNICSEYQESKSRGVLQGIAKRLAQKYGLSKSTIGNIWSDRDKYLD